MEMIQIIALHVRRAMRQSERGTTHSLPPDLPSLASPPASKDEDMPHELHALFHKDPIASTPCLPVPQRYLAMRSFSGKHSLRDATKKY